MKTNIIMKPAISPDFITRVFLGAGLIIALFLMSGCASSAPELLPVTPSPTETIVPPTETPAPPTATIEPSLTTAPTEAPSATLAATLASAGLVITPTLTRIDMLDENNGWGLTDQSVLRTTDGGSQWMDVTPPGFSGPAAPSGFFLDQDSAWILAPDGQDFNSGRLYCTSDAGKTWTSAKVPFSSAALQFLDEMHGWALFASDCGAGSCGGSLFQTSDGGNTWKELIKINQDSINNPKALPLAGDKTGIAFADLAHGWVTGVEPMDNYAWLFATQDGGSTWQHQGLSIPQDYTPAQLVVDPPHFFSSQDGLLPVNIFSGDKTGKIFYATQNGGKTWKPSTPAGTSGVYSFISMEDIWVWDGQTLMTTQDGGKTWTTIQPNVNLSQIITQMDFVTKDTGWAITMDANGAGQLFKTQDGGKTWTPLH